MYATEHDIATLRKLQEVDRKVVSAKKEFKELPHRKAILEVRAKKDEVLKRKVQVQDMLDEAEGKLAAFVQEDELLSAKQDEITETLSQVQGDYRAVTAHTRDLDGVRKRREKVSLELSRVEEEVDKINPVMNQIMQALADLDAKERDLIASFQKVGGSLRAAIEEGEKARVSLAEQVDGELLKVYEKTRSACGGVALSEVHEGACSACRNTFDSSRMSKIRSQAPLATCPVCRRLLIVEGE